MRPETHSPTRDLDCRGTSRGGPLNATTQAINGGVQTIGRVVRVQAAVLAPNALPKRIAADDIAIGLQKHSITV